MLKYKLLPSVNDSTLKGTLSLGFLRFGVKNVLKFKWNAFSRTQNTPRTPREGNQLIFSKKEQTIISFKLVSGDSSNKLRRLNLKTSA